MSAVLALALMVFPVRRTALMSSFGTTDTVTTADDVLVTGNGIDVWAVTIVLIVTKKALRGDAITARWL